MKRYQPHDPHHKTFWRHWGQWLLQDMDKGGMNWWFTEGVYGSEIILCDIKTIVSNYKCVWIIKIEVTKTRSRSRQDIVKWQVKLHLQTPCTAVQVQVPGAPLLIQLLASAPGKQPMMVMTQGFGTCHPRGNEVSGAWLQSRSTPVVAATWKVNQGADDHPVCALFPTLSFWFSNEWMNINFFKEKNRLKPDAHYGLGVMMCSIMHHQGMGCWGRWPMCRGWVCTGNDYLLLSIARNPNHVFKKIKPIKKL